MEARFTLAWNAEELARVLKIIVQDVKEYLTDGRRASFIIERRLIWENPGWTLAPAGAYSARLFSGVSSAA